MAWEQVEILALVRLVKHVRESADRLEKQIEIARQAKLEKVALHFKEAEKGKSAIRSLVVLAEEHVPDQVESKEFGTTPQWEKNLARSAMARQKKAAQDELNSKDIDPRTLAKKKAAVKKKAGGRSKKSA